MSTFTAAEQRVLDALDADRLVGTLIDLVRIPSVTGTDAESNLQSSQAQSLREIGFNVDEWSLDLAELGRDPDFPGMEAPRTEGIGVAATYGGDGLQRSHCKATSMLSPPATWPGGRTETRSADGSRTAPCMGGAHAT